MRLDLPEPVGPVTRIKPRGFSEISLKIEGAFRSSSVSTSDGMVRKKGLRFENGLELVCQDDLVFCGVTRRAEVESLLNEIVKQLDEYYINSNIPSRCV